MHGHHHHHHDHHHEPCCESCANDGPCEGDTKRSMGRMRRDPFGGQGDPRSRRRMGCGGGASMVANRCGASGQATGCTPQFRNVGDVVWERYNNEPYFAAVAGAWKSGSWPPVGSESVYWQRVPCGMSREDARVADLEGCPPVFHRAPRWSFTQKEADLARKLGYLSR